MIMKRLSISTIFLCAFFAIFAQTVSAQNKNELDRVVNELRKDPSLKHASLSVEVYNISKNSSVYSYDSYRSVQPASLTKLFTTAVGFDHLGSKFRFKTTLAYSGSIDKNGNLHGNVYIIGGGDPLLGSYRYRQTCVDTLFASWFHAMEGQGIRSVDGKICYDATIFDNQALHDSWHWGDIGNYYAAGVSGLNFHENMFFIYFNPGMKLGYPASIVSTEPKGLKLRTINEVTTGPEGSGDQVVVYGDPSSETRLCRGTVPLGKKNFSVRASMPNPSESCAQLFAVYLRNHGINVSNSVSEVFSREDGLHTILEYSSIPYYMIAQYANQTSNNIYAESIYKYLGYHVYGKGTYENGARVVDDFFRRHALESSGVNLVDGSGLSLQNRVTADFVCRFLKEVSQMPFYSDYVKTLGKVGESGTAKNMLPNLPSNITVRMKTGSMSGVKSFAGYVTTADGELLCFSVLCNDFDGTGAQMSSKLEKILNVIARL